MTDITDATRARTMARHHDLLDYAIMRRVLSSRTTVVMTIRELNKETSHAC